MDHFYIVRNLGSDKDNNFVMFNLSFCATVSLWNGFVFGFFIVMSSAVGYESGLRDEFETVLAV